MTAKRWVLVALVLTTGVHFSSAQLVNGRFATSFYAWKQYDTVGVGKNYLRAYQTIQLSMVQGDVALHTYLLGAAGGTNDIGLVRAYSLYVDWNNIGRVLDLSLGRQAIFAGVGNGTIDGLKLTARLLQDKVRITGFGGATVNPDFTGIRRNVHDNNSFGGQIVTTAVRDLRVGLSYINRREEQDPYWTVRARDSSYNPVSYYIAPESEAEQYGSADASYSLLGTRLFVYGRYDYDFNLSRTFRGQGNARFEVTSKLSLTADYLYRAPRVAFNSIFSVFTLNAVNEIEGGVEYAFLPAVRAFGKIASVTYSDDKSHRWTLGVNTSYGSVSYAGNDGYAGQLQSFSLQGVYPLLNRVVTPMLGVSYSSYRLSADAPRDNALAILLGAILRPVNAFSMDVQGQLMTNRIYKNDLRLQVRLMYWFAERLSIFRQEVKQ